jgi:O-antigen ligase
MVALRRPQFDQFAGAVSPGLFAACALLFALVLTAALTRSQFPAQPAIFALSLMLLIALGAVAFLRVDPAEKLLQVYIFTMPFNFFVLGGALVSIDRTSLGFRMSLSDLVFPALLLVLIRKRMDAGSPLRTRTMLLFIGLVLALTVSWAQSTFYLQGLSSYSTGKYFGLVYLVLFAAVAVEVIRDRYWWRRSIDSVAQSGALCALLGVLGWLAWRLSGNELMMDGDRLSSTFWGDPNIFGSLLAVSIALSIMRIRVTEKGSRWFWVGCAAVCVMALILSQSRSGTMATALALLVLAIAYRPALLVMFATLGIGMLAIFWSLNVFVDVPLNPTSSGIWNEKRFNADTVNSRTQFWQKGASLLPQEGLAGIGIGSFEQINFVQETSGHDFGYVRAHNSYLSAVLELGITGTLALLLFAVAVLSAVRDGFRHLGWQDRWRLSGLVAGMFGLMLFAAFVDTIYQRHLWVLLALMIAVPNVIMNNRLSGLDAEAEDSQ